MKKRYIFALVIAMVFIMFAVLAFNSNKLEYATFAEAQKTEKRVQIIGSLDVSKDVNYDLQNNQLSFYLVDRNEESHLVKFNGAKPMNFDIADHFVIKGKFDENEYFTASEILTKCPSKYEGNLEDLKQKMNVQ